jgi:hypothetical protein
MEERDDTPDHEDTTNSPRYLSALRREFPIYRRRDRYIIGVLGDWTSSRLVTSTSEARHP